MPMTSQKSLIQVRFAVEELEPVCFFTELMTYTWLHLTILCVAVL